MSATRSESTLLSEYDLLKFHISATKSDEDPFVKLRSHFTDKEEKFIPGEEQFHHSFKLFKKNPKPGASEQRSKNEWIEISSIVSSQKYKEEFCRFNVLMGEVFRFELGDSMPKYRIEEYEDDAYKLITKKLDCIGPDFLDYYGDHIEPSIDYKIHKQTFKKEEIRVWEGAYQGTEILEGTGAACFMKYFYLDDDFHFANALVIRKNGHKLFVPIDHDRCLWTFPAKFQSLIAKLDRPVDAMEKVFSYVTAHPEGEAKFNPNTSIFDTSKIAGVKNKDMGQQDEEDYVNMPWIKHRFPKLWDWMKHMVRPYTEKVSKDMTVKNEVIFFRLKSCLTPYLKRFLVEYHFGQNYAFNDLKNEIHEKMQNELFILKGICEKSSAIHEYMTSHRITALQAMIYEMNLAFHDNKHYMPADKAAWETIWSTVSGLIIKNYNSMLIAQKLPILSELEINKLKLFSKDCENNSMEAITQVGKFYETMGRKFAAAETMKRVEILTPRGENEDELKITPSYSIEKIELFPKLIML